MRTRTELTKSSYCVRITVNQLMGVLDRDDRANHGEDMLFKLMDKSGCIDTNYDGHFGANIYYELDAEYDTLERRENIEKAIIMYADRRPISVIKQKLGLSQ